MKLGSANKICICWVILGKLESFRNYKCFNYYFLENFRCNLTGYESETFSNVSLHCIFKSENFRFRFLYENSLTWEVKCEN